jgi:hypothetical protein
MKSNRRSDITTRYAHWDTVLDTESNMHRIDREPPTTEEYQSAGMALIDSLDEIFSYVREEARLRVDWEETKVGIMPMSMEVSNVSAKVGACFTFGVTWEAFELQSSLKHFAFLSSVGDSFWLTLAKLFEFGSVTVESGPLQRSIPSKDSERRLLANDVSVFSRLMRHHIFAIQDNEDAQVFGLVLSWPKTIQWGELFPKAIEGLRLLYRLEYLLYRCAYIQKRQMVKRVMKEQGWEGSVKDYMPRV